MQRDSAVHVRRRGRNFGVLAILVAFMVVIFAITVVKIRTGGFSEGFDHVARPALIPGQTTGGTE